MVATAGRRRVLVVDDDPKTVELVRLYLEREGYEVACAFDGVEALRAAQEGQPHLIVLDLMLPGVDGLSVCRRIRATSTVPIIMLTARTTERDKLAGLDLGADDYVTKPFSPRELVARVRAVLRRVDDDLPRGPVEVEAGPVRVHLARRECTVAGRPVALTPTEFRILAALVREPGRVFTRDQIIERVLGYEFEGTERTVDVHILNLRRKVEPEPNRPRYLKTVYGVGYKFEV